MSLLEINYNKLMQGNFFKLFKKELLTILRDRKSFFTFIFFSVALTPLLIGGVGLIQELQQKELESHKTIIAVKNKDLSYEFTNFLKSNEEVLTIVDSENPQEDLEEKKIAGYIELTRQGNQITAEYIYDQSSNVSTGSTIKVNNLVQAYSATLRQSILEENNLTEADLNPIAFSQITLQEVQNKPAQNDLVLFLLPYIILLGLIQGAAQFAIELTAGEKERNTLATTLSLNARRSLIALSKISAILVFAVISLILNIGSLILTFTLLSNVIFGSSEVPGVAEVTPLFNINITPVMILEIFIILLPLSFFISCMLVLLGTFARNQKEGGLYIMPLMMATIFIGLSGQAFDVNTPTYVFFVPILGQVVLLKQVLLGYFIPINYLVSLVSTVALFFVALFICIKMFEKEEVIFRQ